MSVNLSTTKDTNNSNCSNNNSTTTFGAIAMMLTCMKNAQMKKLIVAVRVRTLPMTMTMTMKEPPGFVASISSLRMRLCLVIIQLL
jgi:hypothetical protein